MCKHSYCCRASQGLGQVQQVRAAVTEHQRPARLTASTKESTPDVCAMWRLQDCVCKIHPAEQVSACTGQRTQASTKEGMCAA